MEALLVNDYNLCGFCTNNITFGFLLLDFVPPCGLYLVCFLTLFPGVICDHIWNVVPIGNVQVSQVPPLTVGLPVCPLPNIRCTYFSLFLCYLFLIQSGFVVFCTRGSGGGAQGLAMLSMSSGAGPLKKCGQLPPVSLSVHAWGKDLSQVPLRGDVP